MLCLHAGIEKSVVPHLIDGCVWCVSGYGIRLVFSFDNVPVILADTYSDYIWLERKTVWIFNPTTADF